MTQPVVRPRRLRRTPAIRRLVNETRVDRGDLILPMFYREGLAARRDIPSMPGVPQHSLDSLVEAANSAVAAGVGGLMLFAVPEVRDPVGSAALDPEGALNVAVRAVSEAVGNQTVIMADLCLDEFTSHGHCGLLTEDGEVDNDSTLEQYAHMAVALANAGAQVVGTSGMMDGQVMAVRDALDVAGHHDTIILAYAAKYASAFYGPFRDAVESSLQGDRRTYQQDPGNRREALREVDLDCAEGADIVMVKPALPYLDVLSDVAATSPVPVAAYQVSGEYAMIEAAAAQGWIDRESAVRESLTAIKRAGADLILTYYAADDCLA